MTFSFIGWLFIVKAPNVENKTKKQQKGLAHGTNTLLIAFALFYFRLAFLAKGRKANWNRINKQG